MATRVGFTTSQDVAWFKMMGVFDNTGNQVGMRPVENLCQKCGTGLESYVRTPCSTDEERDKALRGVMADVKGDSNKLAQFLKSLCYSGDTSITRFAGGIAFASKGGRICQFVSRCLFLLDTIGLLRLQSNSETRNVRFGEVEPTQAPYLSMSCEHR